LASNAANRWAKTINARLLIWTNDAFLVFSIYLVLIWRAIWTTFFGNISLRKNNKFDSEKLWFLLSSILLFVIFRFGKFLGLWKDGLRFFWYDNLFLVLGRAELHTNRAEIIINFLLLIFSYLHFFHNSNFLKRNHLSKIIYLSCISISTYATTNLNNVLPFSHWKWLGKLFLVEFKNHIRIFQIFSYSTGNVVPVWHCRIPRKVFGIISITNSFPSLNFFPTRNFSEKCGSKRPAIFLMFS